MTDQQEQIEQEFKQILEELLTDRLTYDPSPLDGWISKYSQEFINRLILEGFFIGKKIGKEDGTLFYAMQAVTASEALLPPLPKQKGEEPMTENNRAQDCYFRLQDEGKPYPRSGCKACGKTITSGLGNECQYNENEVQVVVFDETTPLAIRELEAQVEVLTAQRNELEKLVYVPGLWRCAKCNFELIQANLNAHNGTVTARNQPGDKCPNCDCNLWRVTERDTRIRYDDDIEKIFIENANLKARVEELEDMIDDPHICLEQLKEIRELFSLEKAPLGAISTLVKRELQSLQAEIEKLKEPDYIYCDELGIEDEDWENKRKADVKNIFCEGFNPNQIYTLDCQTYYKKYAIPLGDSFMPYPESVLIFDTEEEALAALKEHKE